MLQDERDLCTPTRNKNDDRSVCMYMLRHHSSPRHQTNKCRGASRHMNEMSTLKRSTFRHQIIRCASTTQSMQWAIPFLASASLGVGLCRTNQRDSFSSVAPSLEINWCATRAFVSDVWKQCPSHSHPHTRTKNCAKHGVFHNSWSTSAEFLSGYRLSTKTKGWCLSPPQTL